MHTSYIEHFSLSAARPAFHESLICPAILKKNFITYRASSAARNKVLSHYFY